MDGRSSGGGGSQHHPEGLEGGPEEPVPRWPADAHRASLAPDDGNVPGWFHGVTAREEAEGLLKDKAMGTFLVRLSGNTVGYILSYRGVDRCRHFVVTQNRDGLFVVSGDDRTHGSIGQLVQHYRINPIQPFGEYLTSSCHQAAVDGLYDVVHHGPADESRVSVQALRTLWDREDLQRDQGTRRQAGAAAGPPPPPPPAPRLKSKPRKLTGTVSAGAASQGLPPVPRRSLPVGFTLSGSSLNAAPSDAQGDSRRREERLGGNAIPPPKPERVSVRARCSSRRSDGSPPGAGESERADNTSRTPPSLNDGSQTEEENENDSARLSGLASSFSPPKRVTCQTSSLHEPSSSVSRSNPLYQTADRSRASPAPWGDGETRAEILQKPAEPPEDAYESLGDLKVTKSKSIWSKKNTKLRKFLQDYIKK